MDGVVQRRLLSPPSASHWSVLSAEEAVRELEERSKNAIDKEEKELEIILSDNNYFCVREDFLWLLL